MDPRTRGRSGGAPYQIGPDSMGWAFVGASRTAAVRMLAALRDLPPRFDGSVQAWVVGIHSYAPYRAQAFAEHNAIAHWESDLERLLAHPSIRCVYVANHPRHHAGAVLTALRAGKHVLCEPPLALSPEEVIFLHHSAADRGLTLALHYQHRADAALLTLRDWIAQHELGDLVGGYVRNTLLLPIVQQSWRIEPAWSGVLLDRTLRTVDVVRFLCNDRFARIGAAAGPNVLGPGIAQQMQGAHASAQDDLHALLTMARTGAVFSTHDSFLVPHAPPRVDLFGSNGAATLLPWSTMEPSLLYRYRNGVLEEVFSRPPEVNLWGLSLVAFQESVRAGAPPLAGAIDDLANLRACQAILESIRSGEAQAPVRDVELDLFLNQSH